MSKPATNTEPKNKGGRPKRIFDEKEWKEFENLCRFQCTKLEVCDWFNVDDKTLENLINEKYGKGFSEVFKEKRGKGKVSLRRNQWKLSESNATMGIWLGKNYLDQSDNGVKISDVEGSGITVPATKISNIFIKNYHSCRNDKNITINRGGTSSTKTVSLGQIAMEFLLTGRIGEKTGKEMDIVGQTLPQLKATILKEFWKYANDYGFDKLFEHKKTDKQIKLGERIINYFSVDDEQKVKGRRRDFLVIAEADGITYDTFRQLQLRTNLHTFLEFNPDNEFIWINEELEKTRQNEVGDIVVIQSNYLDNPFLNDKIIAEIELLKTIDEEYWQIFGLGNYGSVAGLIFKDWEIYEELPEKKFITFYGLDLGYSNSQTALIEIKWEVGTINLYLKECFYETGLDYGTVVDKIQNFNKDNEPTFSDSNESRMVGTIRKAGINVFTPPKEVLKSIALLQSFNLFVDSGSPNLIKELKHYKWLKKNGVRLNEPVKFLDHLIDSLRYGILGFINMIAPKYKVLKSVVKSAETITKEK
jgi:phage terminase large subunit